MTVEPSILHATTVAVDGRGVIITGPSGAGKSALALQLLALGAALVADDRTIVTNRNGVLTAFAPASIEGLIEARGVGILELPAAGPIPLALAVDLDRTETERLPRLHRFNLLDIALPCLHNCASPHFPAAILLYLKGNRKEPS